MSAHHPAPIRRLRRGSWILGPAVLLSGVVLAGCADDSLDPDRTYSADMAVAAAVPVEAQSQLSLVDSWLVQVVRSGEGVLAESSGTIDPARLSMTVTLSVTLKAPCESLNILIELSGGGETLFRSEGPQEVCVGTGNGVQASELSWVGPLIDLTPGTLSMTLEEGQAPLSSAVTISNPGGGTLEWTASSDQEWIEVQPSGGSLGAGQTGEFTVTMSDPGPSSGQYQGVVTVSAEKALNSPRPLPVFLTYVRLPRIGLSTTSLVFETDESLNPQPQVFTITNEGGETLEWRLTGDEEWIQVTPAAGSLGPGESSQASVTLSTDALPADAYLASIEVAAPGASNSPQSVGIGLTINPRAIIGLPATSVAFSIVAGQTPPTRILTLDNPGSSTLNWMASVSGGAWLDVSPTSGVLEGGGSQSLTFTADVAGLDAGLYDAVVTIVDPTAINSPQTIDASLQIEANDRPRISNLNVDLLTLNDPSCPLLYEELHGSRFQVSFNYSDANGNLSVAGGSFSGRPVEVETWFPDFPSTTDYTNADVDGDQFSGRADLDLCIVFDFHNSAGVAVRLFDEADAVSNQLSSSIPRPEGAYVPPQATGVAGEEAPSSPKGGSVKVVGAGGM